jgi:endonuclease I
MLVACSAGSSSGDEPWEDEKKRIKQVDSKKLKLETEIHDLFSSDSEEDSLHKECGWQQKE